MVDDQNEMGLAELAELNYLRLEAMDLFERCLTEGRGDSLEAFIERQIAKEPPRLELLRELAADLHQRLTSLREYQADILDRAWETVTGDYGIRLVPAEMNDIDAAARRLTWPQVLRQIHSQQLALPAATEATLRKMLETSVQTALQLGMDIAMTEQIFDCVSDWVDGLTVVAARRVWMEGQDFDEKPRLH